MSILIAGGGLGGLTLALALARSGRQVHVLESAPDFVEIGAGIQLAPNASRALSYVGVLDAVHRHAVFPERIVWLDAQLGERLTELDLGPAFVERYAYPYFVMHRHDLLSELVAACRQRSTNVTLETSKTVTEIVEAGDEVLVHCREGASYRTSALIGADGLHSVVRRHLIGDELVCSEYVAYRGAIPMEKVTAHAGLDNVIFYTGPERHFVQYPLRRGELFNQVAVFKSKRYTADSEEWGTPDELHEAFRNDCGLVRAGLEPIHENRRWPMYDREPAASWSRGAITLLGDAAHPMLQYLAQGAAQALEDAVVLARALDAASGDVERAFRLYERERIPRTAQVQRLARRWGDLWHQHDHAARDTLLRARSAGDYMHTDWFYGYRSEETFSGEHAAT